MAGKTQTAEAETNETNTPDTVAVLCRFDRAELERMKTETGAVADATAVACFVRKNMKK